MTPDQARTATVVLLILCVALAIAALFVHRGAGDLSGYGLTFILGLFGLLGGWGLGALLSPTKAEEATFTKYAGTLSTFLSGYVLSKIEPVFSKYLEPNPDWLHNPIECLRLLTFGYCFLSGILLIYITRAYLQPKEASPPAQQAIQPQEAPT